MVLSEMLIGGLENSLDCPRSIAEGVRRPLPDDMRAEAQYRSQIAGRRIQNWTVAVSQFRATVPVG
jgi:hypothetical protein